MCQIFPSTIYLYGNCNWLISNFIKFISENVLCLNILYMYACCTLYWTTMIILWETKYILEFDYRIETRLKSCVTKIYELLLRKNKWGCFVVWTLVGWVRVRRSKRVHTCVVMWGMGRGVLGVVMKDSICIVVAISRGSDEVLQSGVLCWLVSTVHSFDMLRSECSTYANKSPLTVAIKYTLVAFWPITRCPF